MSVNTGAPSPAAKKRHALAFILLLLAGALFGAFYKPSPGAFSSRDYAGEEFQFASLPALPGWANAPLPDFSGYADTDEKKAAFFEFLFPRIVLANSRILLEREYLDALAAKSEFTGKEKQWLKDEAKRLRVDPAPAGKAQIAKLKRRLDVIPPSLIMAQAANESAWGTSRFAVEGNNLFGQWCFTAGCGLVPLSRVSGASHEVAKFSSPYRSVLAYIQNLNRHPAYQTLRDIRLTDRKQQEPLSGKGLAAGLELYSERGDEYIGEITAMIRNNNLSVYDQAFAEILQDRTPAHLQQLASARNINELMPR
ncbi:MULTISPECIES: glucosaminidase domain-containing protein [unclassified Marinobacter]|uniref:glucosaminidase domain-containing protein n=1 Tax=unclassified Marinobacter TaxID=83889 RepID=UPI000BFA7392|nr:MULTISPECIES: glucosaminidase domain-containing protein [unclassified Marinobacter]PFG11629.1 Bax protein [Marinobacter sp. LV10MA510-1]PFG53452.1 Bax protein [Marinobacter sp. LV10R520-4]